MVKMIKGLGFLGIKLLEIFLGFFALAYHMEGFLSIKTSLDFAGYLIVFVTMPLTNMMSCINLCFGHPPGMARETIVAMGGTVLYLGASLLTMYQAEKDFDMMYLSGEVSDAPADDYVADVDEPRPIYPFFYYSKAQSIAALLTGTVYMLHAFLLVDAMVYDVTVYADSETELGKPLEVYCITRPLHEWIESIDGYERPARRRKRSSSRPTKIGFF